MSDGSKRDQCSHASKCNAPLCPLDEDGLKHCVWYPGEEICRAREFSRLGFIQNQRKIRSALKVRSTNKPRFDVGYFTIDMLRHRFKVTSKVHGLDPNKNEKEQLEQWFKYYKGMSDETLEKMKEVGRKLAKKLEGRPPKKSKVKNGG